ncbi:MAG: Cache 3/Cache 2 fusion domain-containing protein [Bryobacteraceae bacterium]|nr:Cache 3/Cache 2 fusion domain-containing protein [Bryobacteraceae bacterium]
MWRASLRTRLLIIGSALTILPLVIVGGITLLQQQGAEQATAKRLEGLAKDTLYGAGDAVLRLCEGQRDLLEDQTRMALAVARSILVDRLALRILPGRTRWTAKNQFTGVAEQVRVPTVVLGGAPVAAIAEAGTMVPGVDAITRLIGAKATIFVRMNEAGDMLRVATSVMSGGRRAIGTYIPARHPDGNANEVVAAVLAGKEYLGRAFVVDGWYVTGYYPVRGAGGKTEGMIFVGLPERAATEKLRALIAKKQIGKTGFTFVFNAKGATRGRYVMSYAGRMDEKNGWDARDAEGKPYMQELSAAALRLKPEESFVHHGRWQAEGEQAATAKLTLVRYFPAWDWVIAAAMPEQEYQEAVRELSERGAQGRVALVLIALVALAGGACVWVVMAGRLTRRLRQLVVQLETGSNEIEAARHRCLRPAAHWPIAA